MKAYNCYSKKWGTYLGTFKYPDDVKHTWFRDVPMYFVETLIPNDGRRFAFS